MERYVWVGCVSDILGIYLNCVYDFFILNLILKRYLLNSEMIICNNLNLNDLL